MLKQNILWITFLVMIYLAETKDLPDNYVLTKVMEVPPLPEYLKDKDHGVKMGLPNSFCDDGITNIGVDWDGSKANYTCEKSTFPVDETISAIESCNTTMPSHMSAHICMSTRIDYLERLPAFGAHRPMWPSYGEYKFIPPQRWLHSLEHGAIVMLYHPCADPKEVEHLRQILTSCLRRYIITPSKLLTSERPLALISWGCRYEMNYVDDAAAKEFIKKRFHTGPESRVAADGIYNYQQIKRSEVVSDTKDTTVCPDKNYKP